MYGGGGVPSGFAGLEFETMEWNRKHLHTALGLIVFGVIFYTAVQNLDMSWLVSVCKPFLIGAVIAFVLNVPMRAIERKLSALRGAKKRGLRSRGLRVLSLLLTVVLFIGIVMVVCLMIIPEIGRSARTLGGYLSDFINQMLPYIDKAASLVPEIADISRSWETINWADTIRQVVMALWDFLWNGGVLNNTFGAAASLFSAFADFFIGLVFAVYLLLMKETLARQCKRLCYAYFPEKLADSLIELAKMTDDTFSSFLSGQCIEAFILGCMFFIAMTIGRFPYALMISVLIGVTALVPLFGAFIGCAVGTFLILIVSPLKALWFLILFLVLQQVEGNLVYPRVVGKSVGLPAIWVLAAVTIGASVMGITGLFVAIPTFSVVYQVLRKDSLARVREKRIPASKLQ